MIIGILTVLLLSACAKSGPDPTKELGEAYRVALEELIATDTALNSNMMYISLDLPQELDLSESDRKSIAEQLGNKHEVEVLSHSHEELIQQGLAEADSSNLNGILLRAEKQELTEDNSDNPLLVLEATKYRGNQGAITAKITVAYKDGGWTVSNIIPLRES
ncbi:hypothetical protein ACX93W_08190 [Paenibacillus sp. CAU 1782]